MTELITLKDFVCQEEHYYGLCRNEPDPCSVSTKSLRAEAIEWIKNLQSSQTEYPLLLDDFPDSMKGSIAKDKWKTTDFRYGAEYGMLTFIMHFFNLTEEDLK